MVRGTKGIYESSYKYFNSQPFGYLTDIELTTPKSTVLTISSDGVISTITNSSPQTGKFTISFYAGSSHTYYEFTLTVKPEPTDYTAYNIK